MRLLAWGMRGRTACVRVCIGLAFVIARRALRIIGGKELRGRVPREEDGLGLPRFGVRKKT